jgi:hypothetical protein
MKPSEVSNTLKRIASKIDNSKNPKRELVAKDLRKVIAATEQLTTEEKLVLKVLLSKAQDMVETSNDEEFARAFGSDYNHEDGQEFNRRMGVINSALDKAAKLFGLRT